MSRILAAGAARMKLEAENYEARIAALEARLASVREVADILTRNITENGLDTHRMKINGEWHEGPVIDTCRDLLVAVRKSILSALEPHPRATSTVDAHESANVSDKPEGQQEPVAWLHPTAKWAHCEHDYVANHCRKDGPGPIPLYTRPSEQAVTEAAGPFVTFAKHAVEKTDDGWVWRTSSNERICDWFGPSDFGALKAAMEAGHD